MRRDGLTISPGERSPAATSCSIGVNKMKFSRLIRVTSRSSRRARRLSECVCAERQAHTSTAYVYSSRLHAVTANRNATREIKILLMAAIIQSFSHLFLKLFRVQNLKNLGFLGP